MVYAPEQIQATAQQEFLGYLDIQVRTVAPAKVDRVDVDSRYTYLSAVDEDQDPEKLTRLIILLEDGWGERLVDLTTNNDSFAFVARVIRNNFDRRWAIGETWPPKGGCPF